MNDAAGPSRQAILDAALAELLARGIDDFTVEGVAKRAGVDPRVIIDRWHDRRILLVDAQFGRGRQGLVTPDTGTLRGDVLAVAAALADQAESPTWQAWFHRMLAAGRDADLLEIRSDFWEVRFNDFSPVLQRAAERGELREGVDPIEAIRMFFAAYLFDLTFSGTPVRPDYAAQMLDIFFHGITRRPGD